MIFYETLFTIAYRFCAGMLPLFHSQKKVLEEWAEPTAYWSMVSIVTITGFTKPAKITLKQVKYR
ncbi:hypothetical protein [Sporomusa carbonis]|uniref:hypothetical protein n=1 Tax=Sporomusa carbonis TaxID=3076075 RepID=UPI003C7BCC07